MRKATFMNETDDELHLRLPAVLQSLPWKRLIVSRDILQSKQKLVDFDDEHKLLVAARISRFVPQHNEDPQDNWYYELSVVHICCDIDQNGKYSYFSIKENSSAETWLNDVSRIDWYVKL